MSEDMLRLDYGNCTVEAIGPNGLTNENLNQIQNSVKDVLARVISSAKQNIPGFMALPNMTEEKLAPILAQAKRLQKIADTLVVLGIGGSALGATAVDMALAGNLRNAFPRPKGAMRLFVADNPDPKSFGDLLDHLDLEKTAFNVVSKSGTTAETMTQFMVVFDLLVKKLGKEKALERIVFTTDPEKGNLRLLAEQEPGFNCLEVPPQVGGRFSVLSAVGLLPLACCNHDVKALLSGAKAMARSCLKENFYENPAAMIAGLAVEYLKKGRNILVMMPYCSDLFGLAQWFTQLWAESLGKALSLDNEIINTGSTPVACVGATDQHSQLQLFMEGPQDKLIMFVTLDDYGKDIPVPKLFEDIDSLSYLGGKSMGALIKSEAKATGAALSQNGRPSLNLKMPHLDASVMGQVIFLLETATLISGGLLNIDPLNQPGVELGKILTYGLMGRKGFEEQAKRMEEMDFGDKRLV